MLLLLLGSSKFPTRVTAPAPAPVAVAAFLAVTLSAWRLPLPKWISRSDPHFYYFYSHHRCRWCCYCCCRRLLPNNRTRAAAFDAQKYVPTNNPRFDPMTTNCGLCTGRCLAAFLCGVVVVVVVIIVPHSFFSFDALLPLLMPLPVVMEMIPPSFFKLPGMHSKGDSSM